MQLRSLARRLDRLAAWAEGRRPKDGAALDRLRRDPAGLMKAAGLTPDPWQVAFLRSGSARTLLCITRQGGKSTAAAALAVLTALLSPGSLVLCVAPVERQSKELFRKVLAFYRALGRPVAAEAENKLELELASGSRVVALPGKEGTIRSFSGVALLLIDEAARVPDDLYRAVRPMLAVSGGRLVAMSTPFGRRGWFFREWHDGGAEWERVKVTARQCPRIPEAFLAAERRALGELWFAQEYDCQFREGVGDPLFPPAWLDEASRLAIALRGRHRTARAIGCDPGEGVADTSWAVVDEWGLLALVSKKTPDTNVIVNDTITLMRQWNVPPDRVVFDRGGGGKQHADRLRATRGHGHPPNGYPVRTVAFGEAPHLRPRRGRSRLEERVNVREERGAYVNMRAMLYGELALLLDPGNGRPLPGSKEVLHGFAIPAECHELRRQLGVMPKLYDGEQRLRMLPKDRRGQERGEEPTLVELLGCSPDEADSLVLACFGMLHRDRKVVAGAVG